MPAPTLTMQWQLNRLAGTLLSGAPQLDAQGAANKWAGVVQPQTLDLVGALNKKLGRVPPNVLGLNAVCNALAGTVNEDPAYALSTL